LARKSLREQMKSLPLVTTWLAVLVVTDNCTRQCLGLPKDYDSYCTSFVGSSMISDGGNRRRFANFCP
jgi:hypothetical protein